MDKIELLRIANGNIQEAQRMVDWLTPKVPETTNYIERMQVEQKELSERIIKLQGFFMSVGFKGLDEEEKADLRYQHKAMVEYNSILLRRIERAN